MCDCRKCFHFKVCKKAEHVENYKLNGECENFKNIDLVVELPCRVGDIIWCVWQYSYYFRCEDVPFIEKAICDGFVFDEGVVKFIPDTYAEKTDYHHHLIDCCLTKKEAEQALSKLQASYEQVKGDKVWRQK